MNKRDRLLRRLNARCAADPLYRAKFQSVVGTDQLFAGITTPQSITPALADFCRTLNPDAQPLYVTVAPPLWSREDCCSINVDHMIAEKGGSPVYGYKVWANQIYAEAVAHCIWKDPDGKLVDITFNPDGEMSVLFVHVPTMVRTTSEHGGEKPRYALDPDFREIVALEQELQSGTEYVWMPEEDAWKVQPTYEQWLARKR